MKYRPRLSRHVPTVAEKDAAYLGRLAGRANRPPSENVMEHVRKLVGKYHDGVYGYINEVLYERNPQLAPEVQLDNYAFVVDRLQGKKEKRAEDAEQIYLTYKYVPEAACVLRTAPVKVRRKAVVMTALFAALQDWMLPEWCMLEQGIPSPDMIRLGMTYYKDVYGLMQTIADNQEKAQVTIEAILSKEIAQPLADGAL